MKKMTIVLPMAFGVLVMSCKNKISTYDASGIFEAQEIIISSEVSGQLTSLTLTEGADISANQKVGEIDCKDFDLQKSQVEASIAALKLKRGDATPEVEVLVKQVGMQRAQISALNTQLKVLEKERIRIKKLVDQDAAPGKQLDDVVGQIEILNKNIETAERQISVMQQQMQAQKALVVLKNRGVMSEEKPLQSNIDRLENQLANCQIINPIDGVVLAQYVQQFEFVNIGKPLYKIANLKEMTLRAYLTGDQLSAVKLGQEVEVLVDKNADEYTSYPGIITWISDKAEFTPKTIQTKNERSNLVYAVKMLVENDGFLRIGMYGEIKI